MTQAQRITHQSLDLADAHGLRTNYPLALASAAIDDAARYPVGGAVYRERLEEAKVALEWELARSNNALPRMMGCGTASPGPHAEPASNGTAPPVELPTSPHALRRPLHAAYCDTEGEAQRMVVELEHAHPGTRYCVTESPHGWCVDVAGRQSAKEPL